MPEHNEAVLTPQPYYRFRKTAVLIGVILPFVLTIYAIIMLWNQWVSWRDLAIFAVMYVLCGLGITIGYHRMLTHNGFKTHPAVRFTFLALGSMAVESGALTWATTHLKHHALSDQDGDPHSPLEGLWHAHLGWIIDGWDIEPQKYGPWLMQDRMVMFFERTFLMWLTIGLIIPFLLGGWTGLLWGGAVRIFFVHHITWSVNSICHMFGNRMFQTKDVSRNNWLIGLLAFGEGWHNNHHAFPRSALHGMRWYQVDISAYVIRLLGRLRLVWDIQRVTEEQMARKLVQPKSKELDSAAV